MAPAADAPWDLRRARTTLLALGLVGVLAVHVAGGLALGQDAPDGARAWDEPPRRAAPAPAGPFPRVRGPVGDDGPLPLLLEVDPAAGERELGALAEAARAGELAPALRARALDPLLRARLVRDPAGGAALLGAQEAARRRLLEALPGPLVAAAAAAWDQEVDATGRFTSEAAAREALSAHPGAAVGVAAARWLGERCFERGEVEDALLYFRRALALAPPPAAARALEARRLALAARPGGPLGLAPRRPAPPALRWARRTAGAPADVACEGGRAFAAARERLLALDLADGRVVWAAPVEPDPEARLALGHGLVLRAGRAALEAWSTADGALAWALPLEALRAGGADDPLDRAVAAAAAPDGFVALVTLGGGRRVVALRRDGVVRWSTPLWPARDGEAFVGLRAAPAPMHAEAFSPDGRVVTLAAGRGGDPGRRATCPAPGEDGLSRCGAPLVRGVRCPACGHDAEPDVPGLRLVAEAARAASGDGRLACLGDRVLLTSDGLVAALGLERGEVLWALDRSPGLGVAGRRVFVSLRAAADAVEVVTAAGLLVRVDPLDGRLLPPPRGWEADALVLAPAVLAREAAGEVVLPLPTGPLRLDGAARPVGPGAVTGGRVLVAPVASGVVAVDLVAGDVLGRVEWPLGGAAAGRRRLLAGPDGVLLAWGPDGLVALGPGSPAALDTAASAVDSAADDDLDRLAAALDALDWRRRLAAWQALADRAEAAPALRRLLEGGASSEAREAAGELLERLARRARWALIAPGAAPEQVAALADEPTAAAVLALRPLLGQGPGVADALVELLPTTTDVALRAALIDLALRADERLTGQLVAIIHNARATPDLAFAAADYLVELASDGLERPARRALLNPDELTRTMVQAAALRRGDPALLERLRPDPAYWRALEGSPMHQAILGQVGEPDRQTLMDELTRALAPVPGAGD